MLCTLNSRAYDMLSTNVLMNYFLESSLMGFGTSKACHLSRKTHKYENGLNFGKTAF